MSEWHDFKVGYSGQNGSRRSIVKLLRVFLKGYVMSLPQAGLPNEGYNSSTLSL